MFAILISTSRQSFDMVSGHLWVELLQESECEGNQSSGVESSFVLVSSEA